MSASLSIASDASQIRPPDILARLKDGFDDLRPAEQRVAEAVLQNLSGAVEDSSAALAERAGVSEPTVTRFCRALGCEGVRDFKLRLAQALVVGDLYLAEADAPASPEDAPVFWAPILSEARRAVSEVERQLSPPAVLAAAEALSTAGHVVTAGLGGSASPLATEAMHRLFRYGLPVTACTDAYILRMTAAAMGPGDVLVAVSASGRTAEMVEAAQLARSYGAQVVAITASGGPLADVADHDLSVAIEEYPDTLTPTAARFAYLAVLDLLAAATGYAMGPQVRETMRRIKYAAQRHRKGGTLEPLGD